MTTTNLPPQPTPFIGREDELAEINDLLANPSCRLLTLIGPGGIGKTRLAIQAAASKLDTFTDGVFFVGLQSVGRLELIVSSIASSLNYQFYKGVDSQQQLLGFLQGKRMLLVLDNFEHLLQEIDLVINILSFAPQIKLLVTSREALNLRQEWLYQVKGMSYPEINASNIENYDAIQLFAEHARRLRHKFSVDSERTDLIRITRLVEGMPLAIELAATWLKSLSCKAIGDEIQHNLDFLSTNLRDIPQRHQSMQAVFEHSWIGLSTEERLAFMKLTVCQGGCTREAAVAITGASLATLSSLVEKSFLRRSPTDRYEIHELLRQYGEKQLEESGHAQATHDAHTDYYLADLEKREAAIKGHGQLEALNDIEADLENVRKAWEWAVQRRNDKMVNRALESLFWFCVSRHRLEGGVSLFQQVLEKQSISSPVFTEQTLGRVLSRKIHMQALGRIDIDNEGVQKQLARSLAIAERSKNTAETAFCLLTMGDIATSRNRFESGMCHYEQALTLFRHLEARFYMARTLSRIGRCGVNLGRFEDSGEALREALEIARDVGDRIGLAKSLNVLAGLAGISGDYVTFDAVRLEALAIQREMNDQLGSAQTLGAMAIATLYKGDLTVTATLVEESLEIATEINHLSKVGLALILLGLLAILDEDYVKGQQLLEAAHSLPSDWFNATCSEIGLAMVACGQENFALARARMQSLFDAPSVWYTHKLWPRLLHLLPVVYALTLIDEGDTVRGIEILSSAFHYRSGVGNILNNWPLFSRLQTSLKVDLGDEVYVTAWERGKALNLEDVMADILDEFSKRRDSSEDPTTMRMKAANQKLSDPLTPREYEILCCMSEGLTNREIADLLVIGVSTVKKHITHIYSKLGTSDRIKAINQARALHLLPPSTP